MDQLRRLGSLVLPKLLVKEQLEVVRRANGMRAASDEIDGRLHLATDRIDALSVAFIADLIWGELGHRWLAAEPCVSLAGRQDAL
jgi:hypothetical protein